MNTVTVATPVVAPVVAPVATPVVAPVATYTSITTTTADKTALIIGANGMDGSYMCELLLDKGYTVHRTIRRSSVITTERIDHIFDRIHLHYFDITDFGCVLALISRIQPAVIFNFSAQSHVLVSATLPHATFETNAVGVLNLLESVRLAGLSQKTRVYHDHASRSEQYGNQDPTTETKLNEHSIQAPVSICGISKCAAYQLCKMYRDAFNMFIVSGILFNHEGERRGHNFVTQKIVQHVAKYKQRQQSQSVLELGNLNARRDWGYAKHYVEAIYLMTINVERPKDYVIATGESHSVREFVECAFKAIGITIEWTQQPAAVVVDPLKEVGVKKRPERGPINFLDSGT
ncbi:UNVERIFIED_CONTAM: hypothetical protein HDU68_011298 [Siphonaria sp. JEL0065]|nr:hypothetical protein HDU68_011298 [Siphonaria sp. JEL0065]